MVIGTNYNIGDEVWVSVGGKPTKGKVRGINARIGRLGDTIYGRVTYEVISYELPFDTLAAYDRAYRSYNDRADLLGLSRIDEEWADQPIFPMNIMFGNPMTEIPAEGNGEA